MERHQLLDEGEADPGALVRPGAGALRAVEALEDVRELLRSYAGAGVAHGELDRLLSLPDGDGDLAVEGELEGVGHEVQDDGLPHVAVDVDRLAARRAIDHQAKPRALAGRVEVAGELRGQGAEVHRREDRLDAAGFEPGELEQGVHELLEPQPVALDDVQKRTGVGRQPLAGRCQEILHGAEDQRQRCPELVAHVRQEPRLRPIDLREGLGPLALLRIGARVADGRRDVARHQREEAPVGLVERPTRAHPGDQEAGRGRLPAGEQRQHDGRVRRVGPRA
jgi:hypothetical protein